MRFDRKTIAVGIFALLGCVQVESDLGPGPAFAAKNASKKKGSNRNKKNGNSQTQRQQIQAQIKQINSVVAAAKASISTATPVAQDAQAKMESAELRVQEASAEYQQLKASQGDELKLKTAENHLQASLVTRNRERKRLKEASEIIAAAQLAIKQGEAALQRLQAAEKKLVGIDWCRSDPPAFRRLLAMEKSEVRVPNGSTLITSDGCTPRDTFHPKLFVFTSPKVYAAICGSGNLSANGLSRGCEVGSLLVVNRNAENQRSYVEEMEGVLRWLRKEWGRADRYDALADKYELMCRTRVKKRSFVPTDDDNRPPDEDGQTAGRALTEEQIRQLRTFDNFWIDADALGANLGKTKSGKRKPGNQLDMKRFTGAYFGASIENIEPNTEIDKVTLIWEQER